MNCPSSSSMRAKRSSGVRLSSFSSSSILLSPSYAAPADPARRGSVFGRHGGRIYGELSTGTAFGSGHQLILCPPSLVRMTRSRRQTYRQNGNAAAAWASELLGDGGAHTTTLFVRSQVERGTSAECQHRAAISTVLVRERRRTGHEIARDHTQQALPTRRRSVFPAYVADHLSASRRSLPASSSRARQAADAARLNVAGCDRRGTVEWCFEWSNHLQSFSGLSNLWAL